MHWLSSEPGDRVWGLETPEKIKMNALIQGEIDVKGFEAWYDELSTDDRMALTCCLFDYGREYFDGSQWPRIVALAGLNGESPLVKAILSFRSDGTDWYFDRKKMFEWLQELSERDGHAVFVLSYCMFGVNEGGRFDACRGNCDHWWHQDLKDPAVVNPMMSEWRERKRRGNVKGITTYNDIGSKKPWWKLW